MSQRLVSASDWNTVRNKLNTLITDINAVFIESTTGTVTPDVRPFKVSQDPISRTVVVDTFIRAVHWSDSDGLVTKYDEMRAYDSARRYNADKTWSYNRVIVAEACRGRRDGSFPGNTPANITPPVVNTLIKDITTGRDALEIISDGIDIHRNTILEVAPGAEYVEINECHNECYSACHSSCHRNRR